MKHIAKTWILTTELKQLVKRIEISFIVFVAPD